MSNVRIELNSAGIRELLHCPEIAGACREAARAYADRLGEGYELSEYSGRTRVNVSVYAATEAANRDNLENNTMLRGLNNG